ncbi:MULTISPECIES: LysR family transcriptional regulator [unclassified Novosphingobium]|uniref:LysR family transcriptional regulator n=1 Tax=unclassified Novosphingobium TaxID=2644732 RepID=UPI00145BF2EC|nr:MULTISPECIES: LysR family transcriptional regulator [unclassified Novosphingobium]MBB3357840.1 DNA-binding transcriptional LysR family regulator [Novosphingobium sp. BK256]MBB3374201.1 DNA-binding transcriptional LysR family regulator [Novosphingobium sp. BK280]MBB3378613.1 DNA-binding transcriptional LysR family regulator [Novosphingobium sp. BK258]MBB3420307.1 DNA-binding transcriptional LysR family regulator [Novosphingobium sp. BK267]MBB3448571.1 DNA-binding transcriptional LysR family 
MPAPDPLLPNPLFATQVDWNLLRLFADIVKAGGIGAAARRLNKQQPTISAALKRLEEHAGARLLHRSASGVELTAAGRALYLLCEDMAQAARAAPHRIAQALQQVEGLARIQVVSSIVSPAFDAAIASLHARHPAIRIEIRVSPWRSVLDVLERGEAELGVGTDSGVRAGLTYEPLFTETQQLYCARSSPLYGTRVATMASLREQGFVLTGQDEVDTITHLRQRYRLGTVVTGLAEDIHEALRLIRLGTGIGFLPTLAAAPAVASGDLWPLLPDDLAPSYPMYLLTRQAPERGTPAQLFLDEITGHLRAREV